jgi:MoaA/NifB/PqqE/SkfB family radical SAM enzyme
MDARARRTFDGTAPLPDIVTIETTRYCNLHCRMCLQFLSGSTARGPHMTLDAFAEIAARVFPFVKAWQPSIAGEPLLTKDFAKMLALAARHGVQLDVTTNGTIWNDELRDALAHSLRLIQFSFDAVDRELFAAIRVGAQRDDVIANLLALRRRCEELRPHDLPRFGLSVTLMRDNIEQLPDLVDFAATELAVDHLQVMHVFATDAATRAQSLVHAPELARRCIEAAADRAEAHGIELLVHPLDEVTELVATAPHAQRPVGNGDHAAVCAGVRLAGTRAAGNATSAGAVRSELPERIGYCHAAWQRSYVTLAGDVLPCCVPGAPVVGSIWNGDLPSQWNGEVYRDLRRRLVAREPAPICRGCRGYREIDDPHLIARVPTAAELGPVATALDPRQPPATVPRRTAPPELRWPAAAQPADAVLEFSTDRFVTLLYSTASAGTALPTGRWTPPAALWRQAPGDRTVFWRVRSGAEPARVTAIGRIEPEPRDAGLRDGTATSQATA